MHFNSGTFGGGFPRQELDTVLTPDLNKAFYRGYRSSTQAAVRTARYLAAPVLNNYAGDVVSVQLAARRPVSQKGTAGNAQRYNK